MLRLDSKEGLHHAWHPSMEEGMKLIQVDGLIFFLKLYLGKSTLNGLYFNVDLMSTFVKLK